MPHQIVMLFSFLSRALLLFSLLMSTTYGQKQENGERLYQQNCAVCHGMKGQGGVGLPLSAPNFINVVDDHYLRTTIRQGRVGRVMPAFDHLKANEINAIIMYLRSWTNEPSVMYSESLIKGDVLLGKIMYQSICAECHGEYGEGGHGTGVTFSRPRSLAVLPPALNNPSFLMAAKDQVIKAILSKGHKGSPLSKSHEKELTETEIENLVTFIRSFEKIPQQTSSSKKGDSPVIVRESPYDFQTTIQNLKDAVVQENLRVIRVQNLEYGLVAPELENKKQVVVYSCGFNFLYQALKVDPRIGIFLPCRVTVVEQDNKVLVMTINPKKMSALFNNNELDEICDQMYNKYIDLIEIALL